MKLLLKNTLIIGAILALTSPISIAADSFQIRIANMAQDLSFLTKEVAQLRLEVETLTRENISLKKEVDHIQNSDSQLKSQIANLNSALESYKKVMITQVSEEMEQFSKQTQKAIDQLSKTVATSPPPLAEPFKFSDDYSKVGVAYTVKPGDSLSVIALKNGSTVRDIQNANRIAEPRELKAGQVIFVPTKK